MCSVQRHMFSCSYFGKQVVSGKAVVILLPLWMQSHVFIAVSHRKVKLAFSQTLQYSIWYRISSKWILTGSRGESKAQMFLSLRGDVSKSTKYPLTKHTVAPRA